MLSHYDVPVKSDSPPFSPGTVLTVARDSSDQIGDGDLCFYPQYPAPACLSKARFVNGSLELHPLSPGKEIVTLPRECINHCDKVIMAKF